MNILIQGRGRITHHNIQYFPGGYLSLQLSLLVTSAHTWPYELQFCSQMCCSLTWVCLLSPASPSSPEHLPATPAESPAQRFEARIEDGKLYYDKRWWGLGTLCLQQSVCCVCSEEMFLIVELVDKMLLGRGLLLPPELRVGPVKQGWWWSVHTLQAFRDNWWLQ